MRDLFGLFFCCFASSALHAWFTCQTSLCEIKTICWAKCIYFCIFLYFALVHHRPPHSLAWCSQVSYLSSSGPSLCKVGSPPSCRTRNRVGESRFGSECVTCNFALLWSDELIWFVNLSKETQTVNLLCWDKPLFYLNFKPQNIFLYIFLI